MITAAPREFVHRGSVLAAGFIIPWRPMGLAEARRRILHLWNAGVQVKPTDHAFIVLLAEPLRVNAEEAIGEPLVRTGEVLAALPLNDDDVAELPVSGKSVVFAQDGKVNVISLAGMPDEDVAGWIDVSEARVVEVISLGEPPAPPVFQPAEFDTRRDIPSVPAASAELQQLLQELRSGKPFSPPAGAAGGPGFLARLGERLRQVFKSVRAFSFRRRPSGAKPAPARPPAGSGPAEKESWLKKWWSNTAGKLLDFTRFSRLLNYQRSRYLTRMVRKLQSGDLADGLRYAIPMADAGEMVKRRRFSFGLPRPRSVLRISFQRPSRTSQWNLEANLLSYLRNLYRQSFLRLDAQGRVEEAAFVLTELLAEHAEAVSYLEKHGRLRLAAELAEARKLSPALAIRLWWLAKDRRRAIALACRTGEFEAAIRMLADSHPEEADRLRVVWAERLAAEGKYFSAADLVWKIKDCRFMVDRWLGQAIELGGTAGVMALATKAAHFPESFDDLRPKIEELLADESRELAEDRRNFAHSLCAWEKNPQSQALARMAARAVVRDFQQGLIRTTSADLRRLLNHSGDSSLRADVPALDKLQCVPAQTHSCEVVEVAAHDAGRRVITDVAMLAGGRILLALGEAGMLLLSREGKLIVAFNQPAEKLVVSDHGARAIGIATRGSVSRLVRIDLLARTAAWWCDTTITAYTSNFDGSVWPVANGEDIFLVDTLAEKFEVLWKVPDLGGRVRAMQRNRAEKRLRVVTENPKHLAMWTYEQPSCTLRARQQIDFALNNPLALPPERPLASMNNVLTDRIAMLISESGMVFEEASVLSFVQESRALQAGHQLVFYSTPVTRVLLAGEIAAGSLRHATAEGALLAVPVLKEDEIEIFVVHAGLAKATLCARLKGSRNVALRFAGNTLLCADDLGRVVALEVESNRVVRNLRV